MYDINSKEEFNGLILNANDVVVVDFYTPTCGPCKVVKGHLSRLTTETGVKVYLVDCEAHPELAEEYEVSSVPTVLVFENGMLLNQSEGLVSYDKLYGMVIE